MDKAKLFLNKLKFWGKKHKLTGPSWFSTLDETRAPNVKQYLRGLRNYYLLANEIKVQLYKHKLSL